MVLSLVTPVGSDFIKDFPSQNEINMDQIDAYAGPCLPTHDLNTYTPQLLATTTNPTLGTGGIARGFYYRIFDQVYVWGEIRFGTASINIGSGFYSVTLPFSLSTNLGSNGVNVTMARGMIVGNGFVFDNSTPTARQPVVAQMRTLDTVQFGIRNSSGAGSEIVSNTGPIAWAVQDGLLFNVRYKRAS